MMEDAFVQYNYIGEGSGLLMAILVFMLMLYSKPKKTYVYKFVFWGMALSIFNILVNLSILLVANNPDKYYNHFLFLGQLLLFLICYDGILYFIFSYVNMMSIVRRSQRKEFLIMYFSLSAIYYIGVILEIASRNFYSLEMGGIDITHFVRFYSCAGMVCAVFCFNATISNMKNVSRVIWHAVFKLTPIIALTLVVQLLVIDRYHTVFTSMTYVPVFVIGYMLFHSNPYDEVTGCQNSFALEAYLEKNMGKRKFFISYIILKFPVIDNIVMDTNELTLQGIAVCRSMESISSKIKLYKVGERQFVNVLETEDNEEFLKCINSIRGILDGTKADIKVPFNYVITSSEVWPEIDSNIRCRQYFEFVARRFKDQNSSHFYVATPRDYDDFLEEYEILVTLEDIRNRLDLEDERLSVFAQPIYSVETGSFRSAEALARLHIGNKIINPDKFIPLAEESGTIHAITCIVLDKVCKEIDVLEEYYDFDAISINISSREISQENVYSEFFEIMDKYDFDISKIRLEITESAMFENYEFANENINSLSRAGIHFYLDDFGTGYSSMERIMNIPVKTIKFDKSLLYKSLDDNRMDDIMRYMIEVFKKNGFITLVEGVEDESQNQYSVERGFDFIQGYHYAKPEPLENIKKYFTRKNKF